MTGAERPRPAEHSDCADFIAAIGQGHGMDVTVSEEPPPPPLAIYTRAVICPHGVKYYYGPSNEQWAAWAAEAGIE